MNAPTWHFHVSRAARERYGFEKSLYSTSGNVIFLDLHAARLFTQRINDWRRAHAGTGAAVGGTAGATGAGAARGAAGSAAGGAAVGGAAAVAGAGAAAVAAAGTAGLPALRASDMNAMGLIDEILHFVARLYQRTVYPRAFTEALAFARKKLGDAAVDQGLMAFSREFPPPASAAKAEAPEAVAEAPEVVMEELLHVHLANANPAFRPFGELFDDQGLSQDSPYRPIVETLREFFRGRPGFGPDSEDLIGFLGSPAREVPYSLQGQLDYIRSRWGSLLGDLLLRLLTGIDVMREEQKMRLGAGAPPPSEALSYESQAEEREAFSADADWMPRTVMIAKNALVWLDQLSRAYGREIRRLDQVPDEELDRLSRRGFTALWLIGLWERSPASREIKRRMGNLEAEASAYSLYDYTVAGELGGDEAASNLADRAGRRGIRLASDMVPNHTGLDSRWMSEHPERFLSWPHPWPPFPSYTFGEPNLSRDPGMGVYLEDHYWSKSDAAVVFRRVDFRTGESRFLYHGNDGTHMPWNDTAQLDFLNPETREAVIQTILQVARRFPIIRFDAAMTLAKKHFQRLWYPEPGRGGDIPSRAGNGLSRHDFDRAMPNEFWREVVDRVAREAPGTLLLAEAFWLLEGFFVRTLGMHRVYNSAFMNMLKMEDNAGYRQTIRNTLEFDPQVLKRFVNFMSNPDEQTAIDQFGDGDKYFGACTLLATLPGLPMFAHGQVEGLREKYGMEFRRSYWNESENGSLTARHEREIFPLLRRRHVFCDAEGFLLYDFHGPDGRVNEDVFAYSNHRGEERGLVLYHNRYAEARGWLRTSAAFAVKSGGGRSLVQRCLGEGLGLPNDASAFVTFREHRSGMQFIRNCREMWERGLYAELGAYQCQVFLDFSTVRDDGRGTWSRLAADLGGRGVPSLDQAVREMELRPVREPFAALLSLYPLLPSDQRKEPGDLADRYLGFLRPAVRFSGSALDEKSSLRLFDGLLKALTGQSGSSPQAASFLWPWALLRPLCGSDARECRAPSLVSEWMLGPLITGFLREHGWDESAEDFPLVLELALQAETDPAWSDLLATDAAQRFLKVNVFQETLWLRKESLVLLTACLEALARMRGQELETQTVLDAATKVGYRYQDLMDLLAAPGSASDSDQPEISR